MLRRRISGIGLALALGLAAACTAARGDEAPPEPGSAAAYTPDDSVQVRVVVPEVYELANVAIAISEYGRKDPWAVHKDGEYYARVLEHLGGYAGHELVRAIDPLIAAAYPNYYGFRENAFSYGFDGPKLAHEGIYRDVWRAPDLFAEHLALVEDFATASGFREFYRAQRSTYEDQIERYRGLVDLAGMAGWLHSRFPGRRMDAYTVVFSPLIRGSHSTRNFLRDGRREAVMFIAGPDLPIDDASLGVRRGVHERVVFTEIDHNYVNPTTDGFAAEVNRVFGDWRAWNTGEAYASAYQTFNEYMTWGVFTLYAADAYDAATFRDVIGRMERQMEGMRKFVRFRAFNRELLRLYRQGRGATVRQLYAPILR